MSLKILGSILVISTRPLPNNFASDSFLAVIICLWAGITSLPTTNLTSLDAWLWRSPVFPSKWDPSRRLGSRNFRRYVCWSFRAWSLWARTRIRNCNDTFGILRSRWLRARGPRWRCETASSRDSLWCKDLHNRGLLRILLVLLRFLVPRTWCTVLRFRVHMIDLGIKGTWIINDGCFGDN